MGEEAGRGRLWRNRNFVLLTVGQVSSDAGSAAALLAYPLLILVLTGSPVIAGVVGTVRSVTQLLAGLPAGALSDRWDRRRTIVVCDGSRLAVMLLLAALVAAHAVSWPVVLVLSVLDGLGSVLVPAAEAGVLAAVVAPAQLDAAYAAYEARTSTSQLAGTAAGGALFAAGRSFPFLGDAVSYGASVVTCLGLRGDFAPAPRTDVTNLLAEVRDGLRFVWRTPVLRSVILQAPLLNFSFAGALFTVTVALRQHGFSTSGIGGLQAAISVGGLLGALLAARGNNRSILQLVVAVTCSASVLFVVAAFLLPSDSSGSRSGLALFFAAMGVCALAALAALGLSVVLPGYRTAD